MSKKGAVVLKDGVLMVKDLFDITEMEIDTSDINLTVEKLCDISITVEDDKVVVKVWKSNQTRTPAGKVEVPVSKLGFESIQIQGAVSHGEE